MASILVTGSADGLGQMAAQRLVDSSHKVVLHARNADRARQATAAVPGARHVVVGDVSSIAETRAVADQANAIGPFDAVIHNAGVGNRERRVETVDGLEHVFAINVLAPYLLTALHPSTTSAGLSELRGRCRMVYHSGAFRGNMSSRQ
jgi:NAD(P)-dependent dehydrogenase (short-subunit alcohol dehydrogenase family)